MKKKLLIASDNFLPRWDGISRFLSKVVPFLLDDFEVTVLAPNFGDVAVEGFRLVRVERSRFGLGDYSLAKLDFGVVRREVRRADVVFSQTIGPIGFLAVFFGKRFNKRVASYIHSLEWELAPMATNNVLLRRVLYPLSRAVSFYIYNKPDLLVLPSEFLADVFTLRGINTRKVVARLGVDCDLFKPLFERSSVEVDEVESLREALNLEDSFVLGSHGRIANEKDLLTLLRAFKWFRKKYPSSKLLFVGDGVEGIKKKFLNTPGCVLVGSRDDVEKYLNLMDVYVTCSLTETTSLSTLEAMASGLSVVSTPVGFIREYIVHKKNGLFFKPKNSFDLFRKLEFVRVDSLRASRLGVAARKKVLSDFQWVVTSQKIRDALFSLV